MAVAWGGAGQRAVEQGLEAALEPVIQPGGVSDGLCGRIARQFGQVRELAGTELVTDVYRDRTGVLRVGASGPGLLLAGAQDVAET